MKKGEVYEMKFTYSR